MNKARRAENSSALDDTDKDDNSARPRQKPPRYQQSDHEPLTRPSTSTNRRQSLKRTTMNLAQDSNSDDDDHDDLLPPVVNGFTPNFSECKLHIEVLHIVRRNGYGVPLSNVLFCLHLTDPMLNQTLSTKNIASATSTPQSEQRNRNVLQGMSFSRLL